MNGKLIVMEGACDGIGKSTQSALLNEKLTKEGYDVVKHHFPSYGTSQGKLVEEYLSGNYGTDASKNLSPYLINSFYATDRGVTWYLTLKKLYDNGNILLLDRYTTSSIVYQSTFIEDNEEKKAFIDNVSDFEYNKIGIAKPDMVIYLHAPFDLVTKMRSERTNNDGIQKDIHERDLLFMRKVYNNSLMISSYLNWERIECSENGTMRPKEEISEEIFNKIKTKVLR